MLYVLARLRERTGTHCVAMGKVRGTRWKCPHLPVATQRVPSSPASQEKTKWLLAHSYGAAVGFGAADFLHPGWLAAVVALWRVVAAVGARCRQLYVNDCRLAGLPPSLRPTGFHWCFWPWGCEGRPLGRRWLRVQRGAGLICRGRAARLEWSAGWCVRCLSTGSAHHRHRMQSQHLQRRRGRCGRCGGRRIQAHGADRS